MAIYSYISKPLIYATNYTTKMQKRYSAGKMKIVIAIIFSVFSLSLSAQIFNGGLRGGMTATEVSGDNLSGPNKVGWYASVYTFTSLSDYSHLILEILFIQKGSRSMPREKNNFYEYKFYLSYVEIPVQYQVDISRYTNLSLVEKFSFRLGLSVSFLVDFLESDDGTTTFLPGEKKDFHPAELNILTGLSFPINPSLDLSIGFSNGLTPIRPHSGGGTTWYNKGQYNTVWSLGLSKVIW